VKIRKWAKEDATAQDGKQSLTKPAFLGSDMSACSLFELFFDEEVTEHIVRLTKLYAHQKGKTNFDTSSAEPKCFFAILLVSGYVPLPRRRMFWEHSPDVCNIAVGSAMSVNRCEELMRYLHVSDNLNLPTGDKMGKVRPLMTMLNERFQLFWPVENELSIDESMVPYYGRHSTKQFIRGNPLDLGIRCGASTQGWAI